MKFLQKIVQNHRVSVEMLQTGYKRVATPLNPMKTKPASHYHSAPTLSAGLPVLALAALIVLTGGGSPSSAAALRLANTGANTEALPTYRLDWDATSNSTYLVQSATDLGAGAPWTTLDAVFTPDRAGSYQFAVTATDPTGLLRPPATFYRLILPQPQISSVEPAIVPPGVAVDLYVLGQCFPTNAELQINGVTQTGTVYQSSSTLVKPVFTPGATGKYQVSLLVGGLVVSSFTVVCADPLANPELVLQGPPAAEPPASPAMRPAQKGKEKWKNSPSDNFSFDIEQVLNIGSQSSGAGAGKITFNPFSITRKVDSSSAFARPPETGKGIQEKGIKLFDDSLTAGFSAPPDTGKGINQKGLKLFDDSLAAGFEVAAR